MSALTLDNFNAKSHTDMFPFHCACHSHTCLRMCLHLADGLFPDHVFDPCHFYHLRIPMQCEECVPVTMCNFITYLNVARQVN